MSNSSPAVNFLTFAEFEAWSAGFPNASDPNADPDNDGLVNRLEYAFNQNPAVTGAAPVTGAVQTLNVGGQNGRYLTITFIKRIDSLDLSYTPEFSSNLASWIPATELVSSTPGPGSTVTEIWRSSDPVTTAQRFFVRVRIQ